MQIADLSTTNSPGQSNPRPKAKDWIILSEVEGSQEVFYLFRNMSLIFNLSNSRAKSTFDMTGFFRAVKPSVLLPVRYRGLDFLTLPLKQNVVSSRTPVCRIGQVVEEHPKHHPALIVKCTNHPITQSSNISIYQSNNRAIELFSPKHLHVFTV